MPPTIDTVRRCEREYLTTSFVILFAVRRIFALNRSKEEDYHVRCTIIATYCLIDERSLLLGVVVDINGNFTLRQPSLFEHVRVSEPC